jgi:hypothetical protein
MSPELRAELSRRGGKAVQKLGRGYRFTSKSGREAGLKGGATIASKGSEYMRQLGIKGGEIRRARSVPRGTEIDVK